VQGGDSVIASGITPGDIVVTDGQLRLTPNARVALKGGADNGGQSASQRGGGAGRPGGAGGGRGEGEAR
jgi:hypothetical protein